MKIEKVTAVFFSPTKGTGTYACKIAERLSADYSVLDLADPEVRSREYTFSGTDLVIFGAPVYAGRLPQIEGGIFDRLRGDGTPAVFIVSYGNREYEDALLEEQDICEDRGFVGIAAGAFIAPHTFSGKIACGRPDQEDRKAAEAFAEGIKAQLEKELPEKGSLHLPGNHPCREPKAMPFHPSGSEKCTGCGLCVTICPVRAIPADNPRKTDTEKCIDCFACVKNCPSEARGISDPMFKMVIGKLENDLTKVRKEPEQFFIQR